MKGLDYWYARIVCGSVGGRRDKRKGIVAMHHIRFFRAKKGAESVVGIRIPDGGSCKAELGICAHAVVMHRITNDVVSTLFQESRFCLEDCIFAAAMLVVIVENSDSHGSQRKG
jgi:hypothetical protein